MVHAAATGGAQHGGPHGLQRPEKSPELLQLLRQRRSATTSDERRALSKSIYRTARRELRAWRTLWSQHLLDRFKGTSHIQKINIEPVKSKACPIDGAAFADFLGTLFASSTPAPIGRGNTDLTEIPLFTLEEFRHALSGLANLRCSDEQGLVAEMVKHGSVRLHQELLHCFNGVLHTGVFEDEWQHTVFRMLPKDGDLSEATNWRPIAILPILYKIFSRLIYNRIAPCLHAHQSTDQHAFTPGVRIEDALLTAEVVIEYASEFHVPVWLLSMDLRKAFDTVDHSALFDAMTLHGVPACYVELIRILYCGQTGSVHGSGAFPIERGVRQGDVLSSVLFNCVLDIAFERWKQRLGSEGLHVSAGLERLTNTRYADDILLYAKSLDELQHMTELLLPELALVGLRLNASKTRILHTDFPDSGSETDLVEIGGEFISILHVGSWHRYLGRHLSLSSADRVMVEIGHRKKQAWCAFHKHKKVLLNRHVSLRERLKYFDACVSPTVLFALCTLPVTRKRLEMLDTLQRRMLRRIVGWRKLADESWHDAMVRMNERVARAEQLHPMEAWSRLYARSQWRYAQHVLKGGHSPFMRHLCQYNCRPHQDAQAPYIPSRQRGRPSMRWDHYLHGFCRERWPDRPSDHWIDVLPLSRNDDMENEFVNFVCEPL